MEKKTTIIWIVLLAVVVLAGGGLAAWLELSWLAEKKENLKKEKAITADMQAKADKVPELQETKAGLEETAAEERLKIPDFTPDEFDNFVNTVEKMRRRSNTYIGSASVKSKRRARGSKTLPPNVKEITYDFDMGGTFYPLVRFLNLAETQERFVKVESCSISSSSGAERTPFDREMTVTLSTYAYDFPTSPSDEEKEKEAKPEEDPVIETTPIP